MTEQRTGEWGSIVPSGIKEEEEAALTPSGIKSFLAFLPSILPPHVHHGAGHLSGQRQLQRVRDDELCFVDVRHGYVRPPPSDLCNNCELGQFHNFAMFDV